MPRTIDLSGKRALVTGSATGIGEATARCLAEAGAGVMICGRNAQRGEAVTDPLRAAGARAAFTRVDVRADGACEALIGHTVELLGGLDILVNNAGITKMTSATCFDILISVATRRLLRLSPSTTRKTAFRKRRYTRWPNYCRCRSRQATRNRACRYG
jgi:NAD(P)-dependent dehydrogenase (short-subunit alcohol dehydrogenase family)